MSKLYLVGAVFLGLSVYCLLGAFGVGADTAGELFIGLGVPAEFANNASRMFSGTLFAIAVVLQVLGWPSGMGGRDVSHEVFIAAKDFVERQENQ